MERTGRELLHFQPVVNSCSKRSAMIVETREHPYLEAVVKNVMFFLGQGWNLQIFHGKSNATVVRELFSDCGAQLSLIPEISSLSDYSKLMTSVSFWRQVKGAKILTFQTDSFLRKRGVEDFLEYDYVGAPWRKDQPWNLPDFSGGNGGISLRSKPKLIQALKRVPWKGAAEDIYFVHSLARIGSKVAPRDVCMKFATESVFSPDPFAVHKIEKYLSLQEIEQMLNVQYGGT